MLVLGSRSAYTRTRVLEAAARLFALKGIRDTSIREITTEAQVNVSAVNYHFQSKEGLVQAVLRQQQTQRNSERLATIEALLAQSGGRPLDPAQIVDAYFLPTLQDVALHPGARRFMPLCEHSLNQPQSLLRALIADGHGPVLKPFRAAIRHSLPHLSNKELLWRFHFMVGATSCALNGLHGPGLAPPQGNTSAASVTEQLSRRLLAFLTAGLSAPVSEGMQPAAHERYKRDSRHVFSHRTADHSHRRLGPGAGL